MFQNGPFNVSKLMPRNILIGKQVKSIQVFPKLQKCKIKELSFCHKLRFSNPIPNIFTIQSRKP